MKSDSLPFAKLVVALFDTGLWARMSAAARALYPALLRFSDGRFSPVFPSTTQLMKLTGFKQKRSVRDARNELVDLGLISITSGTGRKNTYYHFRFDWVGGTQMPLSGVASHPSEGAGHASEGVPGGISAGASQLSPHNQIHITITNHLENRLPAELQGMIGKFGEDRVRGAVSRLTEAGLPANAANVEGLLHHAPEWKSLRDRLASSLSRESLRILERSLLGEAEGVLRFRDDLPGHLKKIVTRHTGRVEFVESSGAASIR